MWSPVSPNTVAKLLATRLGYSRQVNRKTREVASYPDRSAQCEHINTKAMAAQVAGQPVISVDTKKKKELVGNSGNGGSNYRPEGDPHRVHVHDFRLQGFHFLPFVCRWYRASRAIVDLAFHDLRGTAVNPPRRGGLHRSGDRFHHRTLDQERRSDSGSLSRSHEGLGVAGDREARKDQKVNGFSRMGRMHTAR
jgi:hypothetical protein